MSSSCDTDLEEEVGIAQACTTDELGIGCKAIAPIGDNATLSGTLQEKKHMWRHLMDFVHTQQVQICQTCAAPQSFAVLEIWS